MGDITAEFVEKIEELTDRDKIIKDYYGREYSVSKLNPLIEPRRDTIGVNTLTGFAGYINSVHQDVVVPGDFIHVQNHKSVLFMSNINSLQERTAYSSALAHGNSFPFGQYVDLENFIIALQVHFVQDDTTANILQIVGNIQAGAVTSYSDDGVSQGVTVKAGITRVENVPLPNPVKLAPYRTFPEIEQPYSLYVFRMRQNKDSLPSCALFSVEDTRWQLEATDRIKVWLKDNVKKELPIIG
ncbi:MAG: hypothetical protein A4E63_00205 [Syntrophorhabdus sp. PtaU1.Bin050]|nr:MAG: hypothetical protein A4E63_00205 [Syntrophorhabdus sp. PtaU1.Bin050]